MENNNEIPKVIDILGTKLARCMVNGETGYGIQDQDIVEFMKKIGNLANQQPKTIENTVYREVFKAPNKGNFKLSDEIIAQIKAEITQNHASYRQLSKKYGVSPATIKRYFSR